jgi:uncharacterized protein DUF4249
MRYYFQPNIFRRGAVSYFLISFLIASTGCEKIIDPQLTTAAPLIVIEGSISDQPENQTVKVSRTVAFDQSNAFNAVKGAKVTVVASNSQTYIFSPATDGVYRSQRFRGIAGVKYNLQVVVDGKIYNASSTMPKPVRPDSITFKRISIFGTSRVYPSVYYSDPPNVQNQYRYIIKINGKLIADQVTEDRFSDGNSTSDLITFDDDGVVKGDKIDIEMQCIDRNVFKFYFAISQVGGNGGPPVAPSNPDTNFDNGALGIFSAYTRSNHSLTLK